MDPVYTDYKKLDDQFEGPLIPALEAFNSLKEKYDAGERCIEDLWRMARFCYKKAEDLNTYKERKDILKQGLKYAEEAYKIDDHHFEAAKCVAMLSGQIRDYLNPWSRAWEHARYKKYLDRAISLKPEVYLLYLRGRWTYEACSLTFWQRQSYMLLLTTPPIGVINWAIEDFREANEMNSLFFENQAYLGLAYFKKGQKGNARGFLREGLNLTASNMEKEMLRNEVSIALRECEEELNKSPHGTD